MKANNSFLKSFLLFCVISFSSFSVSFAQADFLKDLFNVENVKKVLPILGGDKKEKEEVVLEEEVIEENICQIADKVLINTLEIENASFETRNKIDKFEDVLNDEMEKRDVILGSVKNLNNLKSKEKIVFGEMRKQIDSAKKYYQKVDQKVEFTFDFLTEDFCDDQNKSDMELAHEDVKELKAEEEIYRKQLVSGLKDKVKVLQEEIKSQKK